jgi:peptide/nickel transport system permease protein
VFFVTHLLGDPARLMLAPEATAEQHRELREVLGLDDPLPEQFARYVRDLAKGDFGDSIWQRVPALPVVLDRLPATLYLAGVTIAISLPLAMAMGIISALKPRSLTDRLVTILSPSAVSIADFWLGLMLILLFAVELRWLPTSGYGGISYVVLPAVALALQPLGRISQVVRSAMLDALGKTYVATARAKGLAERTVVLTHTLRNAALAGLTLTGAEMIALLNGAVVIETIFGWPGVGILLIQAIERRDLPLIEATVFVIAILVVAVNLLVDVIYPLVDPRVRHA